MEETAAGVLRQLSGRKNFLVLPDFDLLVPWGANPYLLHNSVVLVNSQRAVLA